MKTGRFRTATTEEDQLFGAAESDGTNAREDREALSALYPLPPGRWRSIGRHLDYTDWPDRERFMELDRAIQTSRIAAAGKERRLYRNAA